MLVTGVVHTEQQCGNQCQHYHNHSTLHIVAVADMSTLLSRGVRHEQEGLETLESRMKCAELTAL